MDTIENRLKEYIIERYKTLSAFCNEIDMPWSTLDSILRRGVKNANIINILKITDKLEIDAESLLDDKIAPKKEPYTPELSVEDKTLIKKYHSLDRYGKRAVDETIDRELARCQDQDREKEEEIS